MTNLKFWGLKASPFQLKMQALADGAGLPWQRWPEQARTLPALAMYRRLSRARKAGSVKRFPQLDKGMDEYPEVPYYTFDGREFYFDSTGLALHLDTLLDTENPLVPKTPAEGFICRLIDEAFDEFGLYMVHHNRWVTSAKTNRMGEMTAAEMAKPLPEFVRRRIARGLSQRQVRRCPYLFSVAPADYQSDMPEALSPRGSEGFPATHGLLDRAWRRYLAAMESVLTKQAFLLGEQFTLADASAYGQLAMNLVDGRAAQLLQELAPRTFAWLNMIERGEHRESHGDIFLSEELQALAACIGDTFIPLMQQNERAYCEATGRGVTLFNEAAFDRGEALYNGRLTGQPYRAVIKSFQVSVWRNLCAQWQSLSDSDRLYLKEKTGVLEDALFDAAP